MATKNHNTWKWVLGIGITAVLLSDKIKESIGIKGIGEIIPKKKIPYNSWVSDIARTKGMIFHRNIRPKQLYWDQPSKYEPSGYRRVYHHYGMEFSDINAVITKNSIHIYGTATNVNKHKAIPEDFDRTFYIGDPIRYGSYNLIYTGPITKITENSIFYNAGSTKYPDIRKMGLIQFIHENWDLDIESVKKHNTTESYYI